MRVWLAAGTNEIDLHSNDLLAMGMPVACMSRALSFNALPTAPTGALGIVRNNILHAGLIRSHPGGG